MKLNYKRTFLIGFAFLSISAFWQMYDNIIPLMLQNSFHLNEALIGGIMAADNVLAVFLLPFFGILSDRCHTPLGKRTPFIIGGTIIAVAAMLLLPVADQHTNLGLFIAALGVTLLSMAFYRSPAVALMPDLTPKPLRSKANAVINLMGAVGGIYSLIMISLLVGTQNRPDYEPLFISVAALMVLAVILLVATIRENKIAAQMDALSETNEHHDQTRHTDRHAKASMAPDVRRSLIFLLMSIFLWFTAYNAVTTAFSRYAQKVWQIQGGGFASCLMVATAAAIVSYIPIGIISSKIGRKKTILGGIILMTICYLGAFFFTSYHPVINIGFACNWHRMGRHQCQLSAHGGRNEQRQRCRQIHWPLLYIFHGCPDCNPDSFRISAGRCILSDSVSICGYIFRTGLCNNELCPPWRFKTDGQKGYTGKL